MTNQLPDHHHHHHHHHHGQQPQRRAVDLRIPAIEKYAYCLCLHVKPTTIFIAVFKLIRALLFASILLNTEFSMNDQSMVEIGMGPMDDRHRSTAAALTILTRIIMASVSAVAIYAVISGRAALLMPLYAMLLVDFFFTLPAFYNRDLDSSFAEGLSDFRGYPNPNNIQYSRYSQMLFSTIGMIVKIYFLCVIWKCYRYLRLIELVSPIRLSEIYPHIHPTNPQYPIVRVLGGSDPGDLGSGLNMAPPPYETIASSMKPPNYEEAMKTSSMVMSINQPLQTDLSPGPQQTVVYTLDPNSDQQQQQQQSSVSSQFVMAANGGGVVGGTNSASDTATNANATEQQPQPIFGQNGTDSSGSRANGGVDNASNIVVQEQQTAISMVTQQQQQQQPSESQVTNISKSTSNTISIQQANENNNEKSDKHDV